jgi:hypothetical protein
MLESVLDVLACPDCPPARLARERVFSDDLTANALAATLPFAVTGALIAWIRHRLDRGSDHQDDHQDDQGGAP